MITFFRNFFQSRVGMVITLAFVALIGLAFASMDVSSSNTFGGVAGGNRVALVGDEKIDSSELSRAVSNSYDRVRQQNPTLSIQAFVADGGIDQTLEGLVDRSAIAGYAEYYGLRAGDNLVNSEIQRIPGFRGAEGEFSDEAYQQALQQNGLNDAMFRDDASKGLLAQQILVPASLGARIPDGVARRYASLLKERREGFIGSIPSELFFPNDDPTDEQLAAFYQTNRDDYIRPERRVIRFASFGTEALTDNIEPTDAEITARYGRDSAQYAASDVRGFSQLILPTEAAAESIAEQVRGGGSLEAAANGAGFEVSRQTDIVKNALTESTSAAVANAVFAADRGAIATPARSGLGWHVVRVDSVNRIAARSLEQVRSDISVAVREEKRRQAINDLAARIEEEVDEGTSLTEIARGLGIGLQTTKPLLATGLVYQTRAETGPDVLAPVIANAFEMVEGEPQMNEIVRGATFLIYETTEITESATAPLSEIKEEVTAGWRLSEGLDAAKEAADRILAAIAGGSSVSAAFAAEENDLPGAAAINLSREQLATRGQGVEPPLALLFSMAKGTAKKLEAPQNAGWFVVSLSTIELGALSDDDPILAGAVQQLSQSVGQEYIDQLRGAMREELGVERNEAGIEAVRKQLLGEN